MKMHHCKECGLDYICLANGFTVHDTQYGKGISITDADVLHGAIGRMIVTSPHIMRGQEVRFLRSMLDLTQFGMGEVLGVSRATIARWEGSPNEKITAPSAERTLRLFFALKLQGHELVLEICELLTEIDELEYRLSVFERQEKQGTRMQKAA